MINKLGYLLDGIYIGIIFVITIYGFSNGFNNNFIAPYILSFCGIIGNFYFFEKKKNKGNKK